jgi:DNA repair exonuclease SbcCD ATPase subunit
MITARNHTHNSITTKKHFSTFYYLEYIMKTQLKFRFSALVAMLAFVFATVTFAQDAPKRELTPEQKAKIEAAKMKVQQLKQEKEKIKETMQQAKQAKEAGNMEQAKQLREQAKQQAKEVKGDVKEAKQNLRELRKEIKENNKKK